ncbi:secreted protein [Candidatus Vecturithrix granuli]|uniref:Secreted protein n=1 Tax=Vecturithrix granuli TaxID=1499967 RepID=A0A081C9L2_VECG1|nr:secreted protein [Candidatus Vecturithrix granuli]
MQLAGERPEKGRDYYIMVCTPGQIGKAAKQLRFFHFLVKTLLIVCITEMLLIQAVFSEAATPTPGEGEAQTVSLPAAAEQREYLWFSISYVYRAGGQGNFGPLREGSVLHSGDHYKFIFTPTEDCYIYIFQIDSAQKIYQLFPMERFGEVVVNNFNPVQAGATYYLPAESKSFMLDEQTGTETIYFLASRQRDVALEEQYQQYWQTLQQPQPQGDSLQEQLEQLDQLLNYAMEVKGKARIIARTKDAVTTWQEAGQAFSVLQQQLDNMCDGCVYVIRFEHR